MTTSISFLNTCLCGPVSMGTPVLATTQRSWNTRLGQLADKPQKAHCVLSGHSASNTEHVASILVKV